MQSHNSLINPSWNLMLVSSRTMLGLTYFVYSLPSAAAASSCCPNEPLNLYANPRWPHHLGVGPLPPHRPSLRNYIHSRCLGQVMPVSIDSIQPPTTPSHCLHSDAWREYVEPPLLVPKITSWDTNITTPFQHTQPPSTNALLSPQQWFKPDLGLWIFSFVPLLSNQCSGEHFILHSHHDNGLRPRHNSLARFPRLMNFWALAALFKIDSSLIAPTASVDLVAHPSILLRELWLSVFLSSAPYHHQHLAVGSCPVSGRSLHGCPLIHEFGQLPFNLASNSSHLCWAAIQQLLAYPFSHFSSERAQTERKLREKKNPTRDSKIRSQEPPASSSSSHRIRNLSSKPPNPRQNEQWGS